MTLFWIQPPYLYEWSEGRIMFVFDVCLVPGWNVVAKKMLFDFLNEKRFISYVRKNRFFFRIKNITILFFGD